MRHARNTATSQQNNSDSPMEQGGDVLGRSGEHLGSQAVKEAIALPFLALVRAATQAVAKEPLGQAVSFASELQERHLG